MNKVVLIAVNENINSHDSENLGLEIIKDTLEKRNIPTVIYHVQVDKLENIDAELVAEGVIHLNPQIVGMAFTYRDVEKNCELTEKIKVKNPDIHITSGGALATHAAIELLNQCKYIDSVIIGEGEAAILNLCDRVFKGESLCNCPGIAWRDGDKAIKNSPPEELVDLNESLNIKREMISSNNLRWARIETGRGCAGSCTFCAESRTYSVGGRKIWRAKSADKVLEEIRYLAEEYKIKAFGITDNAFEGVGAEGKKRLQDICEKILNADLDIFFTALCRADSFAEEDYDLILLLKKAGLVNVFIGAESGYEETLKIFGKRASVSQTEQAINLFTRAKIAVLVGFIMFHPYSSLEESRANLTFLRNIKQAHRFSLYQHRLMLFHGTPLLKRLSEQGLLKEDFSIQNPYGYKIKDPSIKWLVERIGEYGTFTNVPNEVYLLQNYCEFMATLIAKASKAPERWNGIETLIDTYDEARERIAERYIEFFSKAIDIAETTQCDNEFEQIKQKAFAAGNIKNELRLLQAAVRKFIANNKNSEINVNSLF